MLCQSQHVASAVVAGNGAGHTVAELSARQVALGLSDVTVDKLHAVASVAAEEAEAPVGLRRRAVDDGNIVFSDDNAVLTLFRGVLCHNALFYNLHSCSVSSIARAKIQTLLQTPKCFLRFLFLSHYHAVISKKMCIFAGDMHTKRKLLLYLLTSMVIPMMAASGQWHSPATGKMLTYKTTSATGAAATDFNGKAMTVVYLENLSIPKIGQNSIADDVAWLLSQGWQVIELDYENDVNAVSPTLNTDIIAINNSLKNGKFCGRDCSPCRSYILMEGYRINRDIPYYHDDPTVYNYPDVYKDGEGDWLYLDLVYPASPSTSVPVVVTFSYSNSYATNSGGKLTDANKHKRMYLPYFWGAFNDSFVEGASAVGFAWAVCDHPKYCDWGQGRYTGGGNKSLGAIEVNPDAARKVKSAIRTIRGEGHELGLNGDVAVTGFSRGSTAAALAVGDGYVEAYEDVTRGRFAEESSLVQCALLGPGMFDYEHALPSSAEYTRMKAFVTANPECPWTMQGALATIETDASAPTLFFHNTDDYYKDNNHNPQGLYATQATLMRARLDAVGVPTEVLSDYSSGHAVPQSTATLQSMYDFLTTYITSPISTGIYHFSSRDNGTYPSSSSPSYNLMGLRVRAGYKGIVIQSGRKLINP